MGKRFTALVTAGAIGIGGLTVAAVNPLGVAGAASGQSTTTTAPAAGKAPGGQRAGALKKALDKLVADGTLTQAQAEKVTEAVKAEAKAGHEERNANRGQRRQELLSVVAKAIDSTPEDVAAGLKNGTSIAAQAKAKGVDRQVVVDALTKAFNARIDAAVKDGKLTAARAEKAKARVGESVDRIVDNAGTREGGRRHRPGGN